MSTRLPSYIILLHLNVFVMGYIRNTFIEDYKDYLSYCIYLPVPTYTVVSPHFSPGTQKHSSSIPSELPLCVPLLLLSGIWSPTAAPTITTGTTTIIIVRQTPLRGNISSTTRVERASERGSLQVRCSGERKKKNKPPTRCPETLPCMHG